MKNVNIQRVGNEHYEGRCLECKPSQAFQGYSETEVTEAIAEHFEEEHAGLHIEK